MEDATFTNKVDIWALGCIIYELAVGRAAFREDWYVRMYHLQNMELEIPLEEPIPNFFLDHMRDAIRELLNIKWELRPRATCLYNLYQSYCDLLNFSAMYNSRILELGSYPSFKEWKAHVLQDRTDAVTLMFRLAKWYSISRCAENADPVLLALADYSMEQADYENAISIYNQLLVRRPTHFSFWLGACIAHYLREGLSSTIMACADEIKSNLNNPTPKLILSYLYAANREFGVAIGLLGGPHSFELKSLALEENTERVFAPDYELAEGDLSNPWNRIRSLALCDREWLALPCEDSNPDFIRCSMLG